MSGASGWTSFAKAALVVVGVVGLLGAVAVAAGIVWFQRNGEQVAREAELAMDEGVAEGYDTDEAGCLSGVLRRLKEKGAGFQVAVNENLRFDRCLSTSSPSDNFCGSVPNTDSMFATMKWQTDKCKEAGLSSNACPLIFGMVQEHCHSGGRHQKLNPPDPSGEDSLP